MLDFLRDEGVSPQIIAEVEAFRAKYPVGERLAARVPVSRYLYYGKDVWEEALTALLCGENLLLAGPKATGKNVLAENLAAVFGRPSWDVSFYINTDAATLLGTDTFRDGEVTLRKGPIYQCAECGGFGVLDEINMAKKRVAGRTARDARLPPRHRHARLRAHPPARGDALHRDDELRLRRYARAQ